jgi:hypothetical protein
MRKVRFHGGEETGGPGRRKRVGFGRIHARLESRMASSPTLVSVIAPLQPAIGRARRLLFQPFDLATWLKIGFCAWLAGPGDTQISWLNRQTPLRGGGIQPPSVPSLREANASWDGVRDAVMRNLAWVLPLAIVLVCVIVALGLLLLWLACRGQFMFLHCVALGRAEVAVPWRQHARKARSLFFFRLAIGLVATVVMLLLFVPIGLIVFRAARLGAEGVSWLPLIAAVLALLVVGLAFAAVEKLTRDLVVPIMFLRDGTCREAWSELLGLFAGSLHLLILYLLFQFVLALAIGCIVLVAVIATCCIAGCLLAIPYLGTLLLLPVLVFQRAYSVFYLGQLGPQYNLFQPTAPPAVSST